MNQSPNLSKQMTFAAALNLLLTGNRVRRLSWEDARVYLAIFDEKLMIFKPEDNRLHPLIVNIGDITGTDWVVCRQEIKNG